MFSKDLREPIAVIGIGCRFPGARNPNEFWEMLRGGVDAVTEIPADRWDSNAFNDPDPGVPGNIFTRWGGYIDNINKFDWRAFRIPPREAKYLDPQHRLLLEVVWEALEDAGLPLEKVAGSRTGVFVGIMWNDYLRLQSTKFYQLSGYSLSGNAFAFAPNRISYFFDLKGPSVAVDCACAASLASVHYACQSLWSGEASLAIAGGVNLMLYPDISVMLSKAGLLSPEGHCKTLDTKADGFVRGEGAGIVVLRPFSKLTSADRVYAVIRGSAINHNGHNEWIMAANATGQEEVVRDAYIRAGIDAAEVDYVELHGTGLLKGDAIEAKALGKVVGRCKGRKHPCSVGSVKTNIGHLESAAGIAGIIKVALSLYHGQIPPTLHIQDVNPDIPLEKMGLSVQRELGPWPEKYGANVAGVTAISMSGVNAHVVMAAPSRDADHLYQGKGPKIQKTQILPLSARSPGALSALAREFRDFLTDKESGTFCSLEDLCFTAGVGRSHHEYRLALVGDSWKGIFESLEALLMELAEEDAFIQCKVPASRPRLVFVFTSRTSQLWNLARELFKAERAFRSAIEKCDRLFSQDYGWSLTSDLKSNETVFNRRKSEMRSPALFAFQVALSELWHSLGILPDAVIGFGAGELAAAHIAGFLGLEDAVKAAFDYDRLLKQAGWQDKQAIIKLAPEDEAHRAAFFKGRVKDAPQRSESAVFLANDVESLVRAGYSLFLEIGADPLLFDPILQCLRNGPQEGTVIQSFDQQKKPCASMLKVLGNFYAMGFEVDWSNLYKDGGRVVPLPTYPWQREELLPDWMDAGQAGSAMRSAGAFIGPNEKTGRPLFKSHMDLKHPTSTEPPPVQPLELSRRLEKALPGERRDLLLSYVGDQVIGVLGLDPSFPLNPRQRLFEIGLNSLAAVELMNRLQISLGNALSPTVVFDYPTVASLCDYLAKEVLSLEPVVQTFETQREKNCDYESIDLATVEQLSEEETEALLLKKLDAIGGN